MTFFFYQHDAVRHGGIVDKAYADCEECMSFRECDLMYLEESGHDPFLLGDNTAKLFTPAAALSALFCRLKKGPGRISRSR